MKQTLRSVTAWLVRLTRSVACTTYGDIAQLSDGPCQRCVGRSIHGPAWDLSQHAASPQPVPAQDGGREGCACFEDQPWRHDPACDEYRCKDCQRRLCNCECPAPTAWTEEDRRRFATPAATQEPQAEYATRALELVRAQHYDIVACGCWLCEAARKAGIGAYSERMDQARTLPTVTFITPPSHPACLPDDFAALAHKLAAAPSPQQDIAATRGEKKENE